MTKVGLLSDTHGFLDKRIFKHFESCDEVWHAGDIGTQEVASKLEAFKPFRAVYGNIDGAELRIQYPEDLIYEIEGVKFWMTHIGGYPGRYSPRVREQFSTIKPDVFICGHSHILKVIKDTKFGHLVINPGAAGHHGFHKVLTLLRFDVNQGELQNLEVIELGRRGRV